MSSPILRELNSEISCEILAGSDRKILVIKGLVNQCELDWFVESENSAWELFFATYN